MQIVSLTTDFGNQDFYTAALKGALLQHHSGINFIDISHNVKNFDIVQAAYILKNAWSHFPKGSIHIIHVNDYIQPKMKLLVAQHQDQYFLCPDNGLLSILFETTLPKVFALAISPIEDPLHKNALGKAIAHIAKGKDLSKIGKPVKKYVKRISLQPVVSSLQIRGSVIYIDHYENVITNIQQSLFEEMAAERDFSIYFKGHEPITKICRHYHEVPIGDILCLFNMSNHLEIAINMGNASSLFGLHLEDSVHIDFSR